MSYLNAHHLRDSHIRKCARRGLIRVQCSHDELHTQQSMQR